jgi:hypothetical protein
MSTTRKTAVGYFTLEKCEPSSGHIIVSVRGEPIHKVIGLISDVLDGMNEVEGVYRNYDKPEFVITVVKDFRYEVLMSRIFSDFIESFRKSLRKSDTSFVAVGIPDMARINDQLYSKD